MHARVLIVDDEQDIHRDFEDMLRSRTTPAADELAAAFLQEQPAEQPYRFDLLHALNGEQACQQVAAGRRRKQPISVAYIDIRMPPGIDGMETIRRIRKIDREIEIVIMTAYTDKPLPEIVHDMELLDKLLYIRKPFAREEVQQITRALAEKWHVERKLEAQRQELAASYQRLVTILNSTDEAMVLFDNSSRLLFANRNYEKLMGSTTAQLQELSPEALMEQVRARFNWPLPEESHAGVTVEGRGHIVEHVANGKRLLFHRSRRPVHDPQGKILGELYVYRDVSRDFEISRMHTEVLRLRTELSATYSVAGMIGDSAGMQRVYSLVTRAMDSDVAVLIIGESGTGKEMVAKALHFGGPRRNGPFLAVNCAAIPAQLIESELFGHEQGAFTGAASQRLGCFERAGGGTLLLDEIGDMKPDLQAKMLRVLQEREIQRVGGTESIPVDVRIISSTNKDLAAAQQAGEFRADLYYRLATFPIVVPPLRDRREDIAPLTHHFLKESAARNGKRISAISDAAVQLLTRYDWPGNVRQLQGVIERSVLLESSEILHSSSLPSEVASARPSSTDVESVVPLLEVEHQVIRHALEATANNVSKAADALGINRATLYRKLQKYEQASDTSAGQRT